MLHIEKTITSAQLIDTMHQVTLLQDPEVLPYANAAISLEEMAMEDFVPTTLYVVRNGLHAQHKLRQNLLQLGHDPLRLNGALHINNNGYRVGLVPPIVEDDPEFGPMLIDGAHRVYNARRMGIETVKVIRIKDSLAEAPVYAFPNDWHEIIEYDEAPSVPTLKKNYRDNPKSLYRDFSSLNGSTMREAALDNV
jgi:hypothetical protein